MQRPLWNEELQTNSSKTSEWSIKMYHISRTRALVIIIVVSIVVISVGLLAGLVKSSCSQNPPVVQLSTPEVPLADDTPWLDLRLPPNIIPLHYDLTLFPDFYDNNTIFYGNVSVKLNITEPTQYVLIHIKYLTIESTRLVNDLTGEELVISRNFNFTENEYWVIQTSDVISASSIVTLSMQFEGSLTSNIVGLYRSTYKNSITGEQRYLATSKFQPTYARQAFPCFDEPGFKSTFTVTLIHRPEYTALSNMPVERTEDISQGLRASHFEKSVPMVTYLACFIVCDFDHLEARTRHGIPFRVYAPPDIISQAAYSLAVGVHVLDMFTDYFNVSYPLPKMDMIAIPDFVSGAMEHWGLITYRETYMLYDPHGATAMERQGIAAVISHEIAHMWFGNLVTMNWWDDLWLNEGFASFLEYKGVESVHPDWDIMDQFNLFDTQRVMLMDAKLSSHPIVLPLSHPDQITEVFDAISYSKGASVIRMLESFMGENNFQCGIRKYIKQYEYKTTDTDDLWAQLEQVDAAPAVKSIMDTWTRQMGFPVIHVDNDVDTVYLRQERFLLDPSADKTQPPSPYGYLWQVPFTYETATSGRQIVWLSEKEGSFRLPDDYDESADWIKYNVEHTGYYIVNYPVSEWRKIGRILQTTPQVWSPSDRGGLIADIFNLAMARVRPYELGLELVQYMNQEEHYVPWENFYRKGILYISNMLQSGRHYGSWMNYVSGLTGPVLEKMGFEDRGTHLQKMLRNLLMRVACRHGDSYCLGNATNIFARWLNDGEEVPVGIRSTVYRYGIKQSSGGEVWDRVWQRYHEAVGPQEKRRILYALCHSTTPWVINRLLDYAKDESKIRSQDFFSVLIQVSYNEIGNPIVWDWVRANWQFMIDKFGTGDRYLGRLVPVIVRNFNTEFKLQQVERFYEEEMQVGAGERGRRQAIETIKTNIVWRRDNEDDVISWMARNNY